MRVQGNIMLSVLLAILMAAFVRAADPSAPTNITVGLTTTFQYSNYPAVSVSASAGNITALVLTGITQTRAWQGYYGNISGSITLDDANNYTFYNWTASEPRGQIYATLGSSIGWTGVQCYNYTNDTHANLTTIENYYQINVSDYDGVDETFNASSHPSFQVGFRTMTACPTSYVFQNDLYQTANFVNVLLFDPAINSTGWIYTTLIEDKDNGTHAKRTCYNNEQCDFQILVNEDGHGTDIATTNYYFWVELI
jgi:hypothetical protein